MQLFMVQTRIYRSYRNGNSAIFFRMFVMKIKSCSPLLKMKQLVVCVSSTLVVSKNDGDERINTKTVTVFQSETQVFNSCRSLGYARSDKSIIFFNYLYKLIEIYIYFREKHPFTSYPAAKHPKHNKLAVADTRKKSVDFFNDTARATNLAPAILSRTQVTLQKFPFLQDL